MNVLKGFIFTGLSLGLFIALTLAICRRGLAGNAYVDDRLKPGELSAIQRDLRRAQWAYANEAFNDYDFPAFTARVRDIAFIRIYGVYRHLDGYVTVDCGWVWSPHATQRYELVLKSNVWRY